MSDVIIQPTVTGLKWQGVTAPAIRVRVLTPFITAAGVPVNNSQSPFFFQADCELDEDGYVVVPEITLPSTEDSTVPDARYAANFFHAGTYGSADYKFAMFSEGFRLPASPTSTTWADIDAAMHGALPPVSGDRTVSGGLGVGGDFEVAGASTFGGPVHFESTVSGAVKSFNGRDGEVALESADLNGLSGAGLTGIGTGTGGVLNTGSTTIGADTDSDGVGVVALQTRGVTRLQVESDGTVNVTPPSGKLAVVRRFADKGGQVFNAKAFGAKGDWNGSTGTDDTAALRDWMAEVNGLGGVPFLPLGDYLVNPSSGTEVLLIQRPCIFMGAGNRRSRLIIGPDVSPTTDIIRVAPATPLGAPGSYNDTDLRGYGFRDFGIEAYNGYDDTGQTARPGRHALNFDVSAALTAIYESAVERVYFTDLGGWGVYVTPNASPSGRYAFGYSVVRDSTIYNGLNLASVVDSIPIHGNKLRGKNSVRVSQVAGSTEVSIRDNNIICGGGLSIVNAEQFEIESNIIELADPSNTGTDGALISIHGGVVKGGSIRNNRINSLTPGPALDGIYLQNASGVNIGPNTYWIPAAKARVRLHGTDVTDTQLSLRQTDVGGTSPVLFVLNGAGVVYEAVALSDSYLPSPLPGRLTYEGAKFGTGTHGYSNRYAGVVTPAFGSIAAGAVAEYTISVPGVTIFYDCDANPHSEPGAAFDWKARPATDAVIIRMKNTSGSAATPANVGWTWGANVANT
jgi:hypothetical protein